MKMREPQAVIADKPSGDEGGLNDQMQTMDKKMNNNNKDGDEKKPSDVEAKSSLTWKNMTIRQKCRYLVKNITVEPMVAFCIMPSVLASLATQNLNLEKACKVNLGYSNEVCGALAARNTSGLAAEETAVQQLVAVMQTWKTALQSFFPSILIVFMGAWSDRNGLRKPCMMLPIVGEFLTSISLIACTYWFYELPMEAAGVFEALWPSLTGGWFTLIMGTFSYIGDITSVDSRTVRIGAVNSFLTLGVPVGMALSGILYIKLGFYGVFGIAACCYVFSFMYGLIVIKEAPRAQEIRKALKLARASEKKMTFWAHLTDFFALKHVQETFRVAFKEGPRNRRKRVLVLMLIVMVLIGPMYGEMAVMYLFTRYRFNWNEVQFSFFSTYSMVINLIGTLFAIGVFTHFFKMDDALLGVLSCLSKILASFVYAFATTDWMIYLAPLVDIINGTSFIVMRSITSKLVPPDELGKVNSLFGVCEAIVPLVYGPMYSAIYGATVNNFPGSFFLVGSGLMVPGVIAFLWLYIEHKKDEALEKKQQQQQQQMLASKPKDKLDQENRLENGLTLDKMRVTGEQPTTLVKPTTTTTTTTANEVTGIDNAAFESDKL